MKEERIYIGDSAMTPEIVLRKDQINEDMFTKKQLWDDVVMLSKENAELREKLEIYDRYCNKDVKCQIEEALRETNNV